MQLSAPNRPRSVTYRRSRRLKPLRRERVLCDAVAVRNRTIVPTAFAGDRSSSELRVATTDQAFYIHAGQTTTRLPWAAITAFDQAADPFGHFIIGRLHNGDAFRICLRLEEARIGDAAIAARERQLSNSVDDSA